MATLKDVARRAKVSAATVSRVLNKTVAQVPISEKTRDRVIRAADELDYHPNALARSLRTGRSNIIGVVASDIRDPFFAEVISGIEQVLDPAKFSFLLSSSEDKPEREHFYLSVLRQRSVDGLLLAGSTLQLEDETILQTYEKDMPIVLIARTAERTVPCVDVDNLKGGLLATEHLIKLGHRKIGFIAGPLTPHCRQRWEGYRLALEKNGLDYTESLVIRGTRTAESGYQSMTNLLQMADVPTAVFVYNDVSAFGAMKAVREKGLKIPEDIAIVGFDDITLAAYTDPPLTTVKQPMREMGKLATTILLDILRRGKGSETYKKVILEPELVVRKSCGYGSGDSSQKK